MNINYALRTIILLILFHISIISFGQLLLSKHQFTKYDSLLGSLTPLRSCYDVQKYNINLSIDLDQKCIKGTTKIDIKMLHSTSSIQIDLHKRYTISSVKIAHTSCQYYRDSNHIFINFPFRLLRKKSYSVEIAYQGKPIEALNAPWDGGFVWKKDAEGHHWVGVACEGLGASSWWPCKDHWSDEPDSGVWMNYTVPKEYFAVGNGQLIAIDSNNTTKTYRWRVSAPINIYDVTLNIAKYIHWDTTYISPLDKKSHILSYYVLPENLSKSKTQFAPINQMLHCFEIKMGAYPFWDDGYKLIETPYLGMEHQSAVAYGNKYKSGYLGNRNMTGGYDFDYIIVHESGHEWFGNNISASDPADMWIHEAFTTYSESLYIDCLYGESAAREYINKMTYRVGNDAAMQGPYGVYKEGDGDMYPKGALMINTLRYMIDSPLIWDNIFIKMNQKFGKNTIQYKDIVQFFEKETHLNLSPFFSQYVKHPEIPTIVIDTTTQEIWLEKCEKDLKLRIWVEHPDFKTKSYWISTQKYRISTINSMTIDHSKTYVNEEKR